MNYQGEAWRAWEIPGEKEGGGVDQNNTEKKI